MLHDGCCTPRSLCRHAVAAALIVSSSSVWAQQAAPAEPSPVADAPSFTSGVQPDRRPENAPKITQDRDLSAQQLDGRLHGVSQPYPGNVEEIARTGEWFVPLRHRGMTPPYDIRDWHAVNTK